MRLKRLGYIIIVGLLLLNILISSDSINTKESSFLKTEIAEQDNSGNPIDWTRIASIVAIGMFVIAGLELLFLIRKEKKQKKINQHEFGFTLIDGLFDDYFVQKLLYVFDNDKDTYIHFDNKDVGKCDLNGFKNALIKDSNKLGDDDDAMLNCIDSLLYYLNRFELAIQADLTTFAILSTPIKYYIPYISDMKGSLEKYIENIGYTNAKLYLERWDEWNGK